MVLDARNLGAALVAVCMSCTAIPAMAGGPPPAEGWQVRLGIMPAYVPDYEGSNDYKFRVVPDIEVTYSDWLFFNRMGLGVNLLREGPLTAGIALTPGFGRDQDDNTALRGLGDIDTTAELQLFASYAIGQLGLSANIRRDILREGHKGHTAEVAAAYRFQPAEGLMVFAGPSLTWADGNYMSSFFGINATQAAASRYAVYRAGSGIKDVGFGVVGIADVGNGWSVTSIASYKRLLGDAADSPIVAQAGSADQLFTGIGLSYRF